MEFNHGIIAYVPHPTDPEKVSVVHFCGFVDEPGEEEFKHLYVELKTDPEFGLLDIDFDLCLAPADLVKTFKAQAEADNYGIETNE